MARIVQIPPNHVWLQGDNPSDSTDSRKYGPVSTDLIISRVIMKIEDQEPMPKTFEYLSLDIERDDHSYTLDQNALPTECRMIVDRRLKEEEEANPSTTDEQPSSLINWLKEYFLSDLPVIPDTADKSVVKQKSDDSGSLLPPSPPPSTEASTASPQTAETTIIIQS